MPDAHTTPRFDLLNEPWIPCLGLDGKPRDYGILDVLRHTHELRDVRDPSPLVTYGLYRLLLAVVRERISTQGHHRVGRSFPEGAIRRRRDRRNPAQ